MWQWSLTSTAVRFDCNQCLESFGSFIHSSWHSLGSLFVCLLQKVPQVMRALTPTNSPLSSPSKHGDRFIPSRAGANWSVNFHRIHVSHSQSQPDSSRHVQSQLQAFRPNHLIISKRIVAFIYFSFLINVSFACRRMKNHRIRTGRPKTAGQTAAKVTSVLTFRIRHWCRRFYPDMNLLNLQNMNESNLSKSHDIYSLQILVCVSVSSPN